MSTNSSQQIQSVTKTRTETETEPVVEPVPAGSAEFVARIKAILAAA